MTTFLKNYRNGLVSIIVFLYMSNIPGYLTMPGYKSYISFIPDNIFGKYIFALVAVSIVFFLIVDSIRFVNSNLIFWCIWFLIITLTWHIFDSSDSEVFNQRIVSLGYLLGFTLLIAGDTKSIYFARIAIILAMLLAAVNNVYDFLTPFYFVPAGDVFSNPGRSAGFYINANRAGAALVVGMIFTATLIPLKYRVPYMLIIFIGVLLTFSRMSILAWGIYAVIIAVQKNINYRQLILSIACLSVILIVLPRLISNVSFGEDSRSNIENRLEWITNIGQRSDDESSSERKYLAARSFDMIISSPIFGNGLGSTQSWSEVASTHNIYLSLMADQGVIIGILIIPLLILSIVKGAHGEARSLAIPFGLIIIFIGFFSHNVLDEYHYLIGFALMGAITAQSFQLFRQTPTENICNTPKFE